MRPSDRGRRPFVRKSPNRCRDLDRSDELAGSTTWHRSTGQWPEGRRSTIVTAALTHRRTAETVRRPFRTTRSDVVCRRQRIGPRFAPAARLPPRGDRVSAVDRAP
ncbi:MAG TPA: hypothetical protein DCQ98_07140 [Planctomycetaceae bacterium]|nr:hypothetical protein [Planctomycetaceae bacterium]